MTNDTAPRPEKANIWGLVAWQVARQPDRPAFSFEGRRLSYRDFADLVDLASARLTERGARPGDHVAAMLGKSPEALAVTMAVMRVGAVYVPVNPTFTPPEVAHLVQDARPALFISEDGGADGVTLADLVRPDEAVLARGRALPIAPGGGEPCAMLYTSGTTGRPKGARVSHSNMATTFTAFNRMWKVTGDDRLLHVLPTYHAHGLLMATLCPLFAGGEIMLLPRFDIERVIDLLPEVTVLMAVPTIHQRLAAHPRFTREACRKLRLVTSGSAPLAPDLFDRIAAKTGITLTDRYGSSEAGMIAANPAGMERRGSVGKVLPGVGLRLVTADGAQVAKGEIGRIQVRGPHVFLGYWNRPELEGLGFTSDGWFDTGDLGKLDEDGYLFIVGRDKDMIISGGFNVYPREVEIALESCSGVTEAVVFGVPHPDFGEGVVAAIRATAEEPASVEIISGELQSKLASYKRPKRLFLVQDFPRNAMGKILRNELSATFAECLKEDARRM